MVIKEKFELLRNTPNLISVSESVLKSYTSEENSMRRLFLLIDTNKKKISGHYTFKPVYKFTGITSRREAAQIVVMDSYPLQITFNKASKQIIINLAPSDAEDLSTMSIYDIYADSVYGIGFGRLVTGKVKIGDLYAKPIIDFLTSMFVRLFGKEYGLTEIYTAGIPKLKFLLSCYIFASFFGISNDRKLLTKASSTAPYNYQDEAGEILKYNYSSIREFIRALSELNVMPGMTAYKFTAKIYRFLQVNFLVGLEDLSRFICAITVSSIRGSRMVPARIEKYNQKAYNQIIEISKKVYR